MKKTCEETKLNDLKKRAEKRKNDMNLRHTPSEKDISTAREYARFMQPAQYATLHDD